MPKPLNFDKNDAYQSVLQAFKAVNPAIQKTLARLLQSVPMPVDAACLSLVCTGARMVVTAAFALIADRNTRAEEMLAGLEELDKACQKIYLDRGAADTVEALQGRKTQYPGWTTLASIARTELPATNARLASCGAYESSYSRKCPRWFVLPSW